MMRIGESFADENGILIMTGKRMGRGEDFSTRNSFGFFVLEGQLRLFIYEGIFIPLGGPAFLSLPRDPFH